MKRNRAFIGASLILALSSAIVFADDPAPPTPLQADMKQIGAIFKDMSTNVADTSRNQAFAASAEQLVTLFTDVQNMVPSKIIPDDIAKLPADQQPAALADFKRLIQLEIDNAKALQNAFQSNDNAAATGILQKMGATKKEGHGKYAG